MNWLAIFAKPIGAIVNKGIASAAAATIGYGIAKGLPADSVTAFVSYIALAASTAISGFAATQGVQIPIINSDPSNGVAVVSVAAADKAGIRAVNSPMK